MLPTHESFTTRQDLQGTPTSDALMVLHPIYVLFVAPVLCNNVSQLKKCTFTVTCCKLFTVVSHPDFCGYACPHLFVMAAHFRKNVLIS